MSGRGIGALAAAACVLWPATVATAAPTVSVQGSTLVYMGDDGSTSSTVYPVENGAQVFGGVQAGPGCQPRQSFDARVECPLAGVTSFSVTAGGGNDFLYFQPANAMSLPVTASMGPGDDWYDFGGTARDVVDLGEGGDKAVDAFGDDVYVGGPGDDDIWALTGPGLETNDEISGGPGNDGLQGEGGDDRLDGGPDDDSVHGGDGNDIASGGDGNDVLPGSSGNDVTTGELGNDILGASVTGAGVTCHDPGDDAVDAGAGEDQLCGGEGVDSMSGGDGNDRINSLDGVVDALVSCGAGVDAWWADPLDPLNLDCEQQAQTGVVALGASGAVSVPVGCPVGCTGNVVLSLAPEALEPTGAQPPPPAQSVRRPRSQRLGSRRFRLRRRAASLAVPLDRAVRRRLRRLGEPSVEARAVVTTRGGERFVVRKTFRVRARRASG